MDSSPTTATFTIRWRRVCAALSREGLNGLLANGPKPSAGMDHCARSLGIATRASGIFAIYPACSNNITTSAAIIAQERRNGSVRRPEGQGAYANLGVD